MFFDRKKKIDIEQTFYHSGDNGSYTIFLKHIPEDINIIVSDLYDRPLPLPSDNYTVFIFDRSFYGKGVTVTFKKTAPVYFKVKINN